MNKPSIKSRFKDALRSSTAEERTTAADKLAGLDKFDRAEEVLAGRTGGLTTPVVTSPPASPTPAVAKLVAVAGQDEMDIILRVPLEKVHDNDYNARIWYDPEIIKQRAAEIAADGQKTPALAVPHPDIPGEYMLIEGHYRKRALSLLKHPTIKLTLRRDWATAQQRFVQSWRANEERLSNSPIDNAVQWSKVIDQGVIPSKDKLAELLGVSPATVSKTLALSALPVPVLDKARENPDVFTSSLLYELSLLVKELPDIDVPVLMETMVSEGWSRRDLESYRAKKSDAKQRKPKEISRQHKIMSDGEEVGVIKDWDNGRVQLDIRMGDQAAREQLVAELRKRFGLDGDPSQMSLRSSQ